MRREGWMVSSSTRVQRDALAAAADNLECRKKLSFTRQEALLVQAAAASAGMPESKFMRHAILQHLAAATPLVPSSEASGNLVTKKVKLPPQAVTRLVRESKAAGLTQGVYLQKLIMAAWQMGEMPKAKKNALKYEAAQTLTAVAFQIRKLGTNINQLAKQANNGLVPVTRAEVQYILNQHQQLFTRAIAAVEKMLA
jgi:hypothetical protein